MDLLDKQYRGLQYATGLLSEMMEMPSGNDAPEGGPLYDRNGRFYGVNIARLSRVSSLTIPADLLVDFVKETLFNM